MARPRLSVVIPARGWTRTLAFTLQTCLAQDFSDCEFLVSDNSDGGEVRETVGRFDDRRLRYVRTPEVLAMTDSWEFAVGHAAGEYVTLIGDDDGLLLHALPEIDRILRQIDVPLLRWESVCYTWPNVQPGRRVVPNELLVPLMQVGTYHPIRQVDARPMILAAAHSRISYAQLPMIYCSAVHQDLLTRLRRRTGRVFRGQCPDVYSAFALAYLVGSYYSCAAPMGLSGQSGSSNGHAEFVLGGRSPVTEEFRRLNLAAGHGPHPWVPDLPLMAAKVADSFERAREALFADEPDLMLDRKAVVLACLEGLGDRDAAVRAQAPTAIRGAIRDDPALLAWFETAWKATAPESQPNRPLRRYGGTYLHLDAADFGVSDILGAAALCEKLLGYRADGANAHLEPPRGGSVAPSALAPVLASPAATFREPPPQAGDALLAEASGLHDGETELLRLLLQIFSRLANRTFVDVGAGHGAFVAAFLDAGCMRVHAIEPDPSSARHLRDRFSEDHRVRVLDVAVSSDEIGELSITEGHAGVARVTCRSLGSLVRDGTLPAEVGILKVTTRRHDLEVLRGMDGFLPAVVMVRYGDSPPAPSPPLLEEIGAALAARAYSHVVLVKHHDGFHVLQQDTLATRPGDWGHAIFVHDRVYTDLAPMLRQAIVESEAQLVDAACEQRQHARRLEVIEGLRSQVQLPTRTGRWLRPRLGHLRHHEPRPLQIPIGYWEEPPAPGASTVSVVTATLNAGRFLERTIRSVLDQGYASLEYFVQDGGSADGTAAILERYRGRLTGVAIEKDGGQADALNRGFARTRGEIMAYLNGDDVLLPGALRYVGRFFATHPDVDVVYGHRVLIDGNDNEIGRWVLPRHSAGVLSWADYVPQETLFWRRRIWERSGEHFDDTFHFAMDWELLLRFRANGARFVRLPRFLGAFRVHEDQKTSARMADLGAHEMTRLRKRHHGRVVAQPEIRRHVRGYLLRHMVYQKLYRLGVLQY